MNPAHFAQYPDADERDEFELVDLPVSSDEFWRGIEARLDAEPLEDDEEFEDLLLIQRYFDNEATPAERRRVERRRAAADPRVIGTLRSLGLVRDALRVDRVDLGTPHNHGL